MRETASGSQWLQLQQEWCKKTSRRSCRPERGGGAGERQRSPAGPLRRLQPLRLRGGPTGHSPWMQRSQSQQGRRRCARRCEGPQQRAWERPVRGGGTAFVSLRGSSIRRFKKYKYVLFILCRGCGGTLAQRACRPALRAALAAATCRAALAARSPRSSLCLSRTCWRRWCVTVRRAVETLSTPHCMQPSLPRTHTHTAPRVRAVLNLSFCAPLAAIALPGHV